MEEQEALLRGAPASHEEHLGVVIDQDVHMVLAQLGQGWERGTEAEERGVERVERAVRLDMTERMIEPGLHKRRLGLGVGWFAVPAKVGKLLARATLHRDHEVRIEVADKIRKRRRFAILLAHKQERNVWREEQCRRGQFQVGKAHELAEPFAAHAVSHLIMILGTDHELRAGICREEAMPPLAIRRHLPRIHKALTPGAGERVETAKILI